MFRKTSAIECLECGEVIPVRDREDEMDAFSRHLRSGPHPGFDASVGDLARTVDLWAFVPGGRMRMRTRLRRIRKRLRRVRNRVVWRLRRGFVDRF